MQNKLSIGPLLDEKGNLIEAGYSTELVKTYDRKAISARPLRIKEWDYYIISDGKKAVALTIDDNSYMSLASVSFLDFELPSYTTKSEIKFFSLGKLNFPPSYAEGDVVYDSKKVKGSFKKDGEKRTLEFWYKDFTQGFDFSCKFTLLDEPKDKMVIATPFEKPNYFYYNAKINCMKAVGSCEYNGAHYDFDESSTLATLDWGRGVWPYKNEWYWGSMQCYLEDNRRLGWNIGYGFGDTSKATEDMVFVDGVAHKLNRVYFNIPKTEDGTGYDYMKNWTFADEEGRFKMEFTPVIDRKDDTDVLILASLQDQVFGLFNGEIILDDGEKIVVKDKLGFAEHVRNKW